MKEIVDLKKEMKIIKVVHSNATKPNSITMSHHDVIMLGLGY
jgi:hypothetical protein